MHKLVIVASLLLTLNQAALAEKPQWAGDPTQEPPTPEQIEAHREEMKNKRMEKREEIDAKRQDKHEDMMQQKHQKAVQDAHQRSDQRMEIRREMAEERKRRLLESESAE